MGRGAQLRIFAALDSYLPPLEGRRTFFKKGIEAFEIVLRRGARRKPLGFAMRVLIPGIVKRRADQAFGDTHGEVRSVGELAPHLLCLDGEFPLGHDPAEAELSLASLLPLPVAYH